MKLLNSAILTYKFVILHASTKYKRDMMQKTCKSWVFDEQLNLLIICLSLKVKNKMTQQYSSLQIM